MQIQEGRKKKRKEQVKNEGEGYIHRRPKGERLNVKEAEVRMAR